MINVNMTKAKDIWRDKIRAERTDKLNKLDVEFQKALESSADTTDIVAKKQALRDAPADSRINAATTPDELKLVDPVGEIDV
jgi:hypothetical protein